MNKSIFFSFTIFALLSSCTVLVKKVGFKYQKPKVETMKSVEKCWKKISQIYPTYTLKIPNGNNLEDTIYKKNVTQYNGFFGELLKGAMIFNSKGEKVDLFGGKVCLGKTDAFLKQVNLANEYPLIPNQNIEKYLPHIQPLNRSNMRVEISNADYTVLIPWCNWLGVTKSDAKRWLKLSQENKNVKFAFIPVNVDVINDWSDADAIAKSIKLNVK